MSLLHCRSKFLISALLRWKETEEKATSPKWGSSELKIDSMCPFDRIAQQKFHIWRGHKWNRSLVLAFSKGMSHIHSKISWVAAVFWTSAIRCAKPSSCRTPCGNVHWGKNESSPNQADIATATPARAVEMGTQQIQQKHPGWAEFMRQKQEQEWRAPRLPGLWAHTILWSLSVNTLITMKWFYKTLKTHYDLCLNNPILETSWFPSAHYVASLALVSLNSDLVNIGVSQFLHQDLDWILWHHQC